MTHRGHRETLSQPGSPQAVAYFRVSKKDGSQTTSNQKPEVTALAAARGFSVVATFEDFESGVRRRPNLETMMTAFRRGKFGPNPHLILWSLDRLGRGLAGCFDVYRQLTHLGVRVVSVREPWLDVDGPTRELLVAVLSWVSGFERTRLVERTKAGLQRAKKNGKRMGRPPARLPEADLQRAVLLRAEGWGARRIVAQLKTKVAASTLDKVLALHRPRMGSGKPGLQPGEITVTL